MYELDEYQSKTLYAMANSRGSMTTVMIEPDNLDTPVIQVRLTKYKRLLHDLEVLGLVVDATRLFKEKVDRLNLGRGYKVYIPSTVGFNLFNRTEPENHRLLN